MQLPDEIFKAYDIRGIVDKTLTPELVTLVGRALGSEALEHGVESLVIGRDGRLSGPALADALAQGVLSTGCNVIDIGMVPTPVLYYAAQRFATGTAVQVTGSHNPPEYNGLKMMMAGTTLSGERIQSLKQRIIDGKFTEGQGSGSSESLLAEYAQKILADVTLSRPLKLVIDCGNGVAGCIAAQLFRDLGCEVIELFCEVDGNSPNHHPDPSQIENLQDLIQAVNDHQADFGYAFDGDGDRLGVVSANGDVIWPDRQMLLFAEDILKQRPGAEIIFDVKCTRLLPKAIEQAGGKATMWKTGHSFIKSKLKETGAALAGEMSGHIFFNDRWGGFDDALYAGARLCELLANDSRPAVEVFAALPDTVNTPELGIDMAEGEHYKLVDELVANAEFDDANVSTIDGIRVDFDNGFGLLRASNTTPTLIMRFEATDQQTLDQIQDRFREFLISTRKDLVLPF